ADASAPALAPERRAVRGGTRVLSDQAACPFRAFARWRLRAQTLEAPAEGLDAAARGRLLHALMAHLWKDLKSSQSLERDLSSSIAAASAAAVKELALEGLVSPRFAELERARLARLAQEWLGVERARKPFEVVAVEKPIALRLGTLELAGRIDRLDRIAGGHALIDYKTSRAPSPKHWEPPRPDDAQLPIYAVASQEPVAALAFAKLRPGEMKLMGFSREADALPGVKAAKNWNALLKHWRAEAESLAGAFAGGEARVDPKRGLATCRYCDLQTLCRVYEKLSALPDEPDRENDA
ncbi:MAG TPA: PD-(D/E)XK nuclease family protein, partial [Burkholderiales bacterium]|nr:PD-(D/E)XK nuclease family protein [Burkholderiales bacterium]